MTGQAQATPPGVSTRREMATETGSALRHPASWWAMLALVITEAVFFASLLAGYFYLRSSSPTWPQDNLQRPDLLVPLILTALLVISSFWMQWGVSSIRQGRVGRARLAVFIALLLAAAFLVLQGNQWTRSEFGPHANAYASLFFTITGLQGVNVFIAILMSLFIQASALARHRNAQQHRVVENVALYWHFVTITWVVIFLLVYLVTDQT